MNFILDSYLLHVRYGESKQFKRNVNMTSGNEDESHMYMFDPLRWIGWRREE